MPGELAVPTSEVEVAVAVPSHPRPRRMSGPRSVEVQTVVRE